MNTTTVETDYLVIGSGIAGIMFALKAVHYGSVIIVTKMDRFESNSNYAQGGIASVMSHTDTFEEHVRDTLSAGDGLCHEDIVEKTIRSGPSAVQELIDYGVPFSLRDNDELDLGREGGHSHRRILHVGDMTGKEVKKVLIDAVGKIPNITVLENHICIDLITTKKLLDTQKNEVLGAYVFNKREQRITTVKSKVTVLATGGAGKVYNYTTNPDVATGDGIAMAYRAGARIKNLEFVQFHPTCLYHPEAKSYLISEAVRGEGGILRLIDGTDFMKKYHPMGSLAPRDVAAKAIDLEMKKRGDDFVYLDITGKSKLFLQKRFPNIFKQCLKFGIDISKDLIPVVPAAHYFCGGVETDWNGKTSIHRLYACGEVSCTGLHGANRLASNSLLEALVFANNAAESSVSVIHDEYPEISVIPQWNSGSAVDSDEAVVVSHNWDEIRRFMWNYVGIVRSDKRLARAKARIEIQQREIDQFYWDFLITSDLIELRNIATVAELIVNFASYRKESRGLHYNLDYPTKRDDIWRRDSIFENGHFVEGKPICAN
ncbi:MAG: L-aspartate oxidase [Candidatus Auribacter fodinae]|jgi:L-aspartate oxidase|uniref:L-aspartate oxidase n=1 Tax=Candidatus Auribacter fodinae TaxID=2093366 RepID=A0A3A4QRP2_9BACT|nr:MAG: L-aspartate oxidase [Candidatus Auribacter fodinae]